MAEEISEEQAGEALQQLLRETTGPEESETAQPETTPETTEETVEAAPEVESAEPAVEATEEPAEEVDDVVLLKKRNEELEAQNKATEDRYNSRLKALQERTVASEQILRDRYLRKSNAAVNARKVLQESRTEAGAAEADVERVIKELDGTMHPSSTSYATPQQAPRGLTEDQQLIANDFFNEKGMTQEEVLDFVNWYKADGANQMSARESAVAARDLDGFLRIAHPRWLGSSEKEKKAQTDDAVDAVKSVQRTQRLAAKAASLSTTSPKKQPGGTKTPDASDLSSDDVSKLVRQSVEQYR